MECYPQFDWGEHPNRRSRWGSFRLPCTPELSRFIECGLEIGGSPLAPNLGLDMPDGLPYQPWAAEIVKQRKADNRVDDPHVRCLPDNPPRPWVMPVVKTAGFRELWIDMGGSNLPHTYYAD